MPRKPRTTTPDPSEVSPERQARRDALVGEEYRRPATDEGTTEEASTDG